MNLNRGCLDCKGVYTMQRRNMRGFQGGGGRALRTLGISLAMACCLVVGSTRWVLAIPADDLLNSLKPTADVDDFAGILTTEEKATLEARCRQLRERTGAQLAVVTLKSLAGGQIDDFANKLFARWHIGQKDKSNGLLLLVAMEEHKSRVEVGYGLEPIIPDVLAGRVLDHQLRPRFREKQYAAGISAAVNALCELIEKGEPADRAALAAEQAGSKTDKLFLALFLTIFVAVGALVLGIGLGVKTVPIVLFGLFFWGVAIAVGLAAAWPLAPLIHFPVSLVAGALGWRSARNTSGGGKGSGSRGGSGPSAWDWGNWSGSSGGGWSSGGSGGFSSDWGGFGGGSSGGGGASSDW